MKKALRKSLSILLAVLMVTFSLPLSAFATDEGAKIEISSNATSTDGIDIDEVEFEYYVEINGQAFNGTAKGDDGKDYDITNGALTLPYDVVATINNVENGSTYSVKRLTYDVDKYALIDETDTVEGVISTKDYYVTTDGVRTQITEDEFNTATDNGNNLTVTKYYDADGNAYDEAQEVTGYKVIRSTGTSTTYSFGDYTGYAVVGSVENYNVGITDISCTHYADKVLLATTYSYSNTLTGVFEGTNDNAKATSKTSASNMAGTRTACASALSQNEYRVYYDHTEPFIEEGKMAILKDNTLSPACTQSLGSKESSKTVSYDDIENTVIAFTEVTAKTSVYEAEEVNADKVITFDAELKTAPTGTFSVDFILYGGTIPEAYEGAKFEIKDALGNTLTEDTDYTLDIKSSSISIPILGSFGYTQYIFSGIKHGVYTIQQTEGQSGYSVDKTVYTFEVQRDGTVVGDNFAKSSFDSKYTALTNNTYSLGVKYKVFKNNGFSLKFAKVDQNYDAVSGASFMMVERDAFFKLVGDLVSAGVDNVGGLDFDSLLDSLTNTDWSNIDVGTILGVVLSIVSSQDIELSDITIPAILQATSDENGIVTISNSSNILNMLGALTDSGVSGEQLAEVLTTYFGSVIPEQYLPYLETLASMSDVINVNTGVPVGNYILIESEAPEGYERNALLYTIDVEADGTAFATVGIALPIVADTLNTRFGINLEDVLINEEEFNSAKNTLGNLFDDFTEYQDAVITYIVELIEETVGPETATEEFLTGVRDDIIYYNEQYDNLAEAVGETIKDVQSQITDELTEEWCYFDTRIFVDTTINIVDCLGNDLGFDYVVKDANGNEPDKYYTTKNGVRVPFGTYSVEVTAEDGYQLIEDTKVDTMTVNSSSGDYVCTFEYHTPSEPVTTTVAPTCTEKGYDVTTVTCTTGNEVLSQVTSNEVDALGHTPVSANNAVEPTLDKAGKEADTVCSVCGELLEEGAVIPALKGFTVTVDATDLGTVTINGEDATNGISKKYLEGTQITLTAEAVEGANFIGWVVNGKTTISNNTTHTATVLANVTYTPVFDVETDEEFTVTFIDAFANVVSVQTVSSGADITIPSAPTRPGYNHATENGWTLTNDEIASLTSSATITAQYVKDVETVYTVSASDCDIQYGSTATTDTISVAYDAKVTVTKEGTTAWKVNGVTVAYGDSYTFYVVSDIELVPVTDAVDTTPTSANIGIGETDSSGLVQAVFKATRTMVDGYKYINSGFVYGKGDLGDITLDDVTGTTVKAIYNKTTAQQFTLTYGLRAQSGTMTARAFLAYVDESTGERNVIYTDTMTYTYK